MSKRKFVTETGCTVRVWEDPVRAGRILIGFRMEQPGDGRYAEVRFTAKERKQLLKALKNTPPKPKIPKLHTIPKAGL